MLVVPSAHAKQTYIATWSSLYPSSSSDSNAGCALCHTSAVVVGGGLNSYGVAQANSTAGSIGSRIFDVEDMDSDNDPTMSSNLVEINANTQPALSATWIPCKPLQSKYLLLEMER